MPELIVATSLPDAEPVPAHTSFKRDHNLVRLYAIWTADTPFINNVGVNWRFDSYGGSFLPTEEDRYRDTAPNRMVYAYDPDPAGPFKRGVFRDRQWEAWTVTAPVEDVQTAEINVFTFDPSKIVMLGAAVARNTEVIMTDGPTHRTAHCFARF